MYVRKQLLDEEPDPVLKVLAVLDRQCAMIVGTVPRARLRFLRSVPVWVDVGHAHSNGAMYYTSERWLRSHGVNADKLGCIELAGPEAFLAKVGREPWLMLHELAHAYHHQVVGLDEPLVREAFEAAKGRGLYQQVRRGNSVLLPAYARTNYKEYFAELTEAYFGENDYFPNSRDQLRQYDPQGFAMVKELWTERAENED